MLGLKPAVCRTKTGKDRSYIRFAIGVWGGKWDGNGRPAGVASMVQGGPIGPRMAQVYRNVSYLLDQCCTSSRPVIEFEPVLLADALEYCAGLKFGPAQVAPMRVVVDRLYMLVFDSLQRVNDTEGYTDTDEILNNISFRPISPEADLVLVFRAKLLVLADGLRYPATA